MSFSFAERSRRTLGVTFPLTLFLSLVESWRISHLANRDGDRLLDKLRQQSGGEMQASRRCAAGRGCTYKCYDLLLLLPSPTLQ